MGLGKKYLKKRQLVFYYIYLDTVWRSRSEFRRELITQG